MKTRLIVLTIFIVFFQVRHVPCVQVTETKSDNTGQSGPELILQTGHSQKVEAIVFSPDDHWVASGSFDSTVKIWDLETGRELRSLTGHVGAVKSLACTVDGKLLASGGIDGTVRIWEVESGKEIATFGQNGESVEAIAFSPDGKKLAMGGRSNTILIRDVITGTELVSVSGHVDAVSALAFSPNGHTLASGSADQTVKIWDTDKGKLIRTFKGHTGRVEVLQFEKNGEMLASGGDDKSLRIWRVAGAGKPISFHGHAGKIIAINFASSEKLVSVDSERMIRCWYTSGKGSLLSVVNADAATSTGEAVSAAFSHDSATVAIGNGDRRVTISDAQNGEVFTTLENHTAGFYGVAFSSDNHWLASASFDNSVKLWDLQTGRSLAPLKGHTGRVTCVAFHPDNRRVISGSLDGTLRIWDTITLRPLAVMKGHTGTISTLAVGANGKLIVSGSADKTIGVWDIETNTALQFLKGHTGEVISVAIRNDERLIASASSDATIKIWDTASGAVIRTIEPKAGVIDAVTFSPDGKYIASGGADKNISIWDAVTGSLVRTIAGHTARIYSISFSADGSQIVSSSQDKSVRVWNVGNGSELRNLSGHAGTVFSATYLPDERWVASASEDGSIIIWNKENSNRLATLISLNESEDWLVATPEGFFDGTQSSWSQLSWRFEKNTFNVKPVEVFFSEFWLPGLLSELLNDKKLPANVNISGKDRRQPALKLSMVDPLPGAILNARERTVRIFVSDAPAGAKDVRLFRNGSLVKIWRGDVLNVQTTAVLETNVPIVAGNNRLTAYAYNSDDIKSRDSTITVVGPPVLVRKGISYILAVGINDYANTDYNLNLAVADAIDFAGELKRQQAKIDSAERIETTVLQNRFATKENILKAIADVAAKIQPEDWLTIFFAGHGVAKQNRFYLIPHDLGYLGNRDQRTAADLQTILDHGISDEEIYRSLEDIDAGNILLVLDACNSGQALEAEEKRRGPMNSKGLAQLAYEKGMFILTAAQSQQNAIENERLGHGYLTYALVEEGLKTNVADRVPKDGQVLLREWLDYATERVPQIDQEELDKDKNKGRQLERDKAKAGGQGADRVPQRPRVFYRREAETRPLVVARP